jgi:tetratricopeptide (TPR) repeat protein
LLPNTFAAKRAYYPSERSDFPALVFEYLCGSHMAPLAPLAGIGVLRCLWQIARRQPSPLLIPFAFSLSLFAAYWYELPYLYHNGRYIMPILPFFMLLGFGGVDWVGRRFELSPRRWFGMSSAALGGGAFALLLGAAFAVGFLQNMALYANHCRYITERQVRAGRWLASHVPEGALIATHDVGAIAFYSGRRVLDMVGLVSPEMIPYIGDLPGLRRAALQRGATHLAVLRNWFEVVNLQPIYQTDEREPEILEIFAASPALHLMSPLGSALLERARIERARGELALAEALLWEASDVDARSSRLHCELGEVLALAGKRGAARLAFQRALALHPSYPEAQRGLERLEQER